MNDLARINPHEVQTMSPEERRRLLLECADAIDGGGFPGLRLKYAQGTWSVEGVDVDLSEEYLADPNSVQRLWEQWWDSKPTKRVPADLRENVPPRSELGDDDPADWQFGPDGYSKKDPWQETFYISLTRLRDDTQIAFGTSSDGGKRAISSLMRAAAWRRPDEKPIITLGSSSYKNKKFNTNTQKPIFAIRNWVGEDGAQPAQIAPPAPAKRPTLVDLDDDIPF
jgi:hypothetical protein